jgi:hypothetical protein
MMYILIRVIFIRIFRMTFIREAIFLVTFMEGMGVEMGGFK